MADKVGSVYIEIQARMGSLEADLKRLQTNLNQTDKSGVSLSESFRRISVSSSLFGTKTSELTEKNNILKSKMQELIEKGIDPTNKGFANLLTQHKANSAQLEILNSKTGGLLSSFGALGGMLTGGAIATGIFKIGSAALKASAEMEQNKVAFTTMLGSASMAANLLKEMSDFAATTPFEMTEIVRAGKQLTAFGVSAQNIIPTLTKLGDIASGLNIPLGELSDIYGKIKTSNRIMGDDLRQLGGRGIPIVAELAKVFGVTESQVYKLAEDGKIGFKQFNDVIVNLTKSGSKFGGLMAEQSKTLGGQWSNFNDALTRTLIMFGDELAPAAKDTLGVAQMLIESFGKINGLLTFQSPMLNDIFDNIKRAVSPLHAIASAWTDIVGLINSSNQATFDLSANMAEGPKEVLKVYDEYLKQQKASKQGTDGNAEAWKKLVEEAKKFNEELSKDSSKTDDPVIKIQQELMMLDGKQNKNDEYRKKGLISERQYAMNLEDITAQRTKKEAELEKAKFDQIAGYYNNFAGVASGLSSQLSNLVSMSASNQTAEIDNNTTSQLESIQSTYDAQALAIEGEAISQEEKNAKLKALDEQKARDEKAVQLKADKEKRKIAREAAQTQKALSIFQVLITTPTAAMNAYNSLAGIPFIGVGLGLAAAAATVAMGAAQIALIADAPLPALAQGGVIPPSNGGTTFTAGEAGSAEAVIPLNDATLSRLAKMINNAGGGSGQTIQVIVNLDGTVIYTDLYKATKDGRAMISERAVVA